MRRVHWVGIAALVGITGIAFAYTSKRGTEPVVAAAAPSNHQDLVNIYREFRDLHTPKLTNGVPDYSSPALPEQRRGLKQLRDRLSALEIASWPIPEQVDYHIVRAETNGLDFYHRVLRPWSTDPEFYTPSALGLRPRGNQQFPLQGVDLAQLTTTLRAVPAALEQARRNLSLAETQGDLVPLALKSLQYDSEFYQDLATQLSRHHPSLVSAAQGAKTATEEYAAWLRTNRARMKARSGVGKEQYNEWLRNVWLMPYTWEECWALAEREYARAIAALRVEEVKNRALPPLQPVKTEDQFNRNWQAVEAHVLKFVREEPYFSVPDYLVPIGPRPSPTWAQHLGRKERPLPFFLQVADRDPMMEVVHNTLGHNFDSLRAERDKRPIRGQRRLFGLSKARSEAGGFTLEEMLMHAGVIDNAPLGPRGREIIYVAAAYRAVRAMADLKMHSREATYEQANELEAAKTPRGWSTPDNFTTWSHRRTTPRVPGNEMGYLIGKIQFEKTLADRATQLGEQFEMRDFMDRFFAAGTMPISLIRWEVTGLDDEIKKLAPVPPISTASTH